MPTTPDIYSPDRQWQAKIYRMMRIAQKSIQNAANNSTIQFTIGDGNPGTPLNGTDTYANPSLDGQTIRVYKNGTGYLTEGVDFDTIAGGGIQLTSTTFDTADTYLIWIL